ncbi:MAG: putative membrane protein, partial [Flavobacteriales bacterium]
FWLVLLATILGVGLSFTKLRKYEGAGASKLGSVFLYILVASIGLHIDFEEVINKWQDIQWVIYIGFIWMFVHIVTLLIVAKVIKAPFFFVAVGSQANVGGAASAPIVASAFSPALAPVGVLLAVLGYAIGTIGAIVCMELMHAISM